jgi:hypothetical protein
MTKINKMTNMSIKSVYALQPYKAGSKNYKSLVLVIPASVVKQYNINSSTIFTLIANEKLGSVIIKKLNNSENTLEEHQNSNSKNLQARMT